MERASTRLQACWLAAVLVCLALSCGSSAVHANDLTNEAASGQDWAILVGVENYEKVQPLRFTVNDVRKLGDMLTHRGEMTRANVLELTDAAENPRFKPLKANLLEAIPRWLALTRKGDRLIFYFSGHGIQDAEGKLYLAPLDCDPANLIGSSIPVAWLRDELAKCPASFKLLLLDACHAGAEKATDNQPVIAAQDLGEPFRELPNLVTIASSTGNEKSQLWPEKEQSLFSFWLYQGLKGHADVGSDGVIDIDEIYQYLHSNVSRTAQKRFQRSQTPVRIVRSGTMGVPAVLRLKPLALKQVLDDVAEELAWAAEEQQVPRMAVLEFTEDTALGELLGANFGLLGRHCSKELQDRLAKIGAGKFQLTDHRRLQAALKAQQFSTQDLGSQPALTKLSAQLGGLPSLALGSFHSRVGRALSIRCQLIKTETGDVLCSAGGTAALSESEWAMLGQSGWLKPEDRYPPIVVPGVEPPAGSSSSDPTSQAIARLDEQQTHPLKDPQFPFRLQMVIGGRERKGTYLKNPTTGREEYVVPVRAGEVYSLQVETNTTELACVRLLVDGLNTLPQVISTSGVDVLEVAPRVNLENARHWVLDPQQRKRFSFAGFVTTTGAQGKLKEFTLTDAESSFAGRKQFNDQLGLITAAFYYGAVPKVVAGSGRGPLGTTGGTERTANLTERKGVVPGDLWGVVHLRYVNAAKESRP